MKKKKYEIILFLIFFSVIGPVFSKDFSECTRPVFEKYISEKTILKTKTNITETEIQNNAANLERSEALNNLKQLDTMKTISDSSVPGPGKRDSSFPINMTLDKPLFKGTEVQEELKVHQGEKILNLNAHPYKKGLKKESVEPILSQISKSPQERENSFIAIAGYPSKDDDCPEFPVGTANTRKEELLRLRALTFKINGRPNMPFYPLYSGKFENSVHKEKAEINKNPFDEIHQTDRDRQFSTRPSLSVASRPDRPSAGSGQQLPGTGPGTSMPYIPKLP